MMEYDEVLVYLLQLEKMGLVRKQYDPVSRDFLWELTSEGLKERKKLGSLIKT